MSSNNFSLIFSDISGYISLLDFTSLLSKITPNIKKTFIIHNPCFPSIGTGYFQVDYKDNSSLENAINILQNKFLLNYKGFEKCTFTKKEKNKNTLKNIQIDFCRVFAFYNLQINTVNALEFKNYINNLINNESPNKNIKILKLIQYSNKIIIEFNIPPKFLFKYFTNDINNYYDYIDYDNNEKTNEEKLYFRNRIVPIKPLMKPINNIGKYKEKNNNLSIHSIKNDDLNSIINQLKNVNNEEILKKKAEIFYKKKLEEKEKEKGKEKEREREFSRKKRERERSKNRERNDYKNNNNNNNNNINNLGNDEKNNLINTLLNSLFTLMNKKNINNNQISNNNIINNNNNNNNNNLLNNFNFNKNNLNNNNNNNNNFVFNNSNNNISTPINTNNNPFNYNTFPLQNNISPLNSSNNTNNFLLNNSNFSNILSNNNQLNSLLQNFDQQQQLGIYGINNPNLPSFPNLNNLNNTFTNFYNNLNLNNLNNNSNPNNNINNNNNNNNNNNFI